MTTLTLALPKPHSAQRRTLREAHRFNVLCCGRRWGKTVIGVDRLIKSPLKGQPAAYFSPTYKMGTEVWRAVKKLLRPVISSVNAQERRIELITGGVIDFWSLDSPDSIRGRKYATAVIDEAAMVGDLETAWLEVIRPTLADYEGGAWLLSTPRGQNYFKVLFDHGQDPLNLDWASWQMPTSTNPHIKATEVEAMRRGLPYQRYAQEVLAIFSENAGGVFRNVMDAATAVWQNEAVKGHSYVFGVDWGRSYDYTVVSVKDVTMNQIVCQDRFTETGYDMQVGRLRGIYDRFKPYTILAEKNSFGDALIEDLVNLDLPVQPFVTTNASKKQVIEELALAFEQHTLAILSDSVLISELQAYEYKLTPSGNFTYNAPTGKHDDTVIATALAHHAGNAPSLLLW